MTDDSVGGADRRVDIVLAEYAAVRAEMNNRTTIQATLVTTGIAAIGVVLGVALGQTANPTLLILVPAISAFVLLIYSIESYRIIQLGDHVRTQFDRLRRYVDDPDLPSWEHTVENEHSTPRGLVRSVLDAPLDAILIVGSAFAAFHARGVATWAQALVFLLVPTGAALHYRVGLRGGTFMRPGRRP